MTAQTRPGRGAEASSLKPFGRHDRHPPIKFFTIAETAEMLRVSTRSVRRWIVAGELVAHHLGRAVRIAECDLRAFLALHRQG